MLRTASLFLLVLAAGTAFAQNLTIEQIMADPDWIGSPPEQPYWSDDALSIYFEQKLPQRNDRELLRLPLAEPTAEHVSPQGHYRDSNRSAVYNANRTTVAWVSDDDVFFKRLPSGSTQRLTTTMAAESAPVFIAAGAAIAYKIDDEYFVHDIVSGRISEFSDLRFTDDPGLPDFDVLRQHQLDTYTTVADDLRRTEATEAAAQDRKRATAAAIALYLGKDNKPSNRWLSPNGRHLLLTTTDAKHADGQTGKMPNYVTASGYVELTDLRTRVGRSQPASETLWLIDSHTNAATKISLEKLPGANKDPLANIRKQATKFHIDNGADAQKISEAVAATLPRPVRVEAVRFSADGARAALRIHSIDNKDRWIVVIDFADGGLSVQHQLTDSAWINYHHNEFGWFADGQSLWFLSEESGYAQLYRKTLSERRHKAITKGQYIVADPVLSSDQTHFYFRANTAHPGTYDVYRIAVSGGEPENLTALGGVDEFSVSPDDNNLLVLRGRIDRHPELYNVALDTAPDAREPRRLTNTVSHSFAAIDWSVPQIIEIPSSKVDQPIYSKLYLPDNFDPTKNYPAVMFVHGAGYTQNAHGGWSYYFREYMFHNLLNQHGYVVLDMDYRASKGYGRDWRTAIYRQMGHPELEDFIDGVDFLVSNYNVDAERIGIYGGSYGGFMTFMALFRAPDVFAAGAALRPVSDWMHYNHGYTSNILNTPLVDPMAYQRSSPINFAEGLNKPLLIAAGMQDDNVFFQDAVLMVQRLMELEKPDFETAIYPLDPHGFVHASAWLDEYRRIFKLMETHLKP